MAEPNFLRRVVWYSRPLPDEELAVVPLPQSEVQCVCIPDWTHIVRTNIVIDDKLMRDTLRTTGLKTKREAVETGLRTILRLGKQAEIRKLRGKLEWRGDLDAMRTDN